MSYDIQEARHQNNRLIADEIYNRLETRLPLKVLSVKVKVNDYQVPREYTFWDLNFKGEKDDTKNNKVDKKAAQKTVTRSRRVEKTNSIRNDSRLH